MIKQILLYILVFIFGAFISLYSYVYKVDENVRFYISAFKDSQMFDLEEKAYQAYKEEDPLVAIWAITNFLDRLNNVKESVMYSDDMILTTTYIHQARLALVYKKLNDNEKYNSHMNKALSIINENNTDKTKTIEDILNYVKILDKSANERRKKDKN